MLKGGEIKTEKLSENVGAEKGKLFPTDLGTVVTDFLTDHFKRVMDYSFTAKIEEEFDEVAHGKIEWQNMIDAFYKPFHQMVELAQDSDGRAAGERQLGKDPVSGKPVIARLGRFGPMVQIGSPDDEDKPRFASLRDGQSIETISYEEALNLFKLPMALGLYEGDEVEVNIGRFGPYVKWREKFISLPKGAEPLDVTLEQSIRYIQEKERADAPIGLYEGFPVTKGTGRFGPFLKWNDLYINVPKAYNFEALSKGDIETLISTKVEKEANRYIQNWEAEKITIENGRWGPFINWNKKKLNLDRKADGSKPTPEEAALFTLEDVKKMIVAQVPGAFEKKAAKKATAGKTAAKKPATRKAAPPKGAAAKAKPKPKAKPKS